MPRQQRLDVLIEPVGGTEEQIALQVEALDLAAMRGKHRLVVARAVERTAILRAVEAEFDESIRDALSAKVAQPITTPIRMPAMKPHCRMMTMIASSDRYSVNESRRRDSTIHL